MAERDRRSIPLALLENGLLLLGAMAGFTASFLTLYGDGDMPAYRASPLDLCAARLGEFLLLAAVLALLSLAVWSLSRSAAAWSALGLWAAAVLLLRERLLTGAILTAQTIADLFARRVSWGMTFSYDSGLTASGEGTAAGGFLALALMLLALALGWAVVRARCWWAVVLLTLLPLLPGLVADLYPNWPAFLALSACWCAMLLTDLSKWAAPSARGKLTLAALGGSALVLGALSLAAPIEGYTRPAWALRAENELLDLTDRVSDFFSRWDGPFRSTVTYVGSAGEADLAGAGPLHYTGRTVLRVKSDFDGQLYLRGTSLAVYEDGVWKALPEGTWQGYLDALSDPDSAAPPLLFPALSARSIGVYTATVENVDAENTCVYAPYFLIPQDWAEAGMLPVEDSYLARRSGWRTNTVTFEALKLDGSGYESPEADTYREYVYRHYLDVPEGLEGTLRQLLDEGFRQMYAQIVTDRQPSIDDFSANPAYAVILVTGTLDELCEYDPETPAAPNGEDPVLYFLNESHRGYCMHYASAATLMLRSLGIPARYVSGFTVDCVPGRTVNIPDRAAHAWVEVWVDGFGWYPVEVTPAAAFTWYEQGSLEPTLPPSEPVEESETPEPTPTPTPAPTPTPGPDATEAPTAQPSAEPGGTTGRGFDPAVLLRVAKVLAAAAGVFALFWLGQFLPKLYRDKKLSGPDRNRAALDGYRYLLRLERWGGRVDERALELARKAKFSQHILTQAELDELRALVDRERGRLCVVLGPVERLVFRYLWGGPKKRRKPENSGENGA